MNTPAASASIRIEFSRSHERKESYFATPTADVKFELLPVADCTFIRRDQSIKYTFVKSAAYNSLAEAYMANGEKELAIANYKKALELNPKNTNGAEMLKKLENSNQ